MISGRHLALNIKVYDCYIYKSIYNIKGILLNKEVKIIFKN